MGLSSPLYQGLYRGLLAFDGWWPRGGAPTPIADFDFSKPVTAYDFTSAYATDEWTLSGPTAGKYANGVGTATLDNTGGLEDQEAIGLFNGTDPMSIKAWEAVATGTDKLECSSTSVLDSNNADLCMRVVFRLPEALATNRFLGKRVVSNGAGWDLRVRNTLGNLRLDLEDTLGNQILVEVNGGSYCDGAWHYLTFWYDDSADLVYIKTDLEDLGSTSTSTMTGSMTNSTALRVGLQTTGSGQTGQFAYVGGVTGANAQSMYDEDFWDHATDPTGLLETASRASAISVPVSASRVAHFGVDQLPIGYHSAFDAGTYALYCNSDVTNLLTYSELLSNWSNKSGTPTVTDKDGDDPAGFRRATSIVATANNDQLGLNFTTTASTEYTIGVQLKRKGGSDVTGRVIFYDETGAAELAAQAFTATADYNGWVMVTATTNVGQVSSSIRIEIDTSGEGVFASMAQANAGDGLGAYIRTEGSTASLAASDYSRDTHDAVAVAEGELLVSVVRGRIRAGTMQIFDADNVSGDDARRAWFAGDPLRTQLRHNGTTEADHTGPSVARDTKTVIALQWGESLSTTEMRQIVNGTKYDDAEALPYDTAAAGSFESLQLGAGAGVALPAASLDGWIQSIKSYDQLVSEGA